MKRFRKILNSNIVSCACALFVIVALHHSTAPAGVHRFEKPRPGEYFDLQRLQRIAAGGPNTQVATHNIGNLQVGHTNLGQFGTGFIGNIEDPVTGEALPSATFPANSDQNYLYVAAFWIGAVVGRDTLVSFGADDGFVVHEFWPGEFDSILHRSIIPGDPFESQDAISEQDLIATYYDTLDDPGTTSQDDIDNRPHIPLGIKVVEKSLQWSYDYASDFILFDYGITNISRKKLNKVYMGIYVDGDVHHTSKSGIAAFGDDICGFKATFPAECNFIDTINMAYIMDNDGDPENGEWDKTTSVRSVAGVRLIRTPSDSLVYSFNWWTAEPGPDFGPRKAGTPERPFRDMNGFIGAPRGDKNKYYVMSNNEFDYDQLFTAVDHTADGWLPPPPEGPTFVQGADPKFLLSFGPFDIFPGETLPITFAYLGGENFHNKPDDFELLLQGNEFQPEKFFNSLNFKDFGINSRWASWIYDNPGVDTDGDGFAGDTRICVFDQTEVYDTTLAIDSTTVPPETTLVVDTQLVILNADTTFFTGDGVPDFRGASPPPAPQLRVEPSPGRLIVNWNGLESETSEDPFSGEIDFEGYRVYISRTDVRSQFTLLSSYDRKNFNRFYFDSNKGEFVLLRAPFTIEELQEIYGPTFNPDFFDLGNPLVTPGIGGKDSVFYFAPQDFNADDLANERAIHKPARYRYNYNPDGSVMLDRNGDTSFTPPPHTLNLDSAFTSDTFLVDNATGDTTWYMGGELTEDGKWFKYYEYEFIVDDVLPSVPLYVSVTAFDYGSPESELTSLESNPLLNAVQEFPLDKSPTDISQELNVIVYPNPYRIDGRYRELGFEGAGRDDLPDERVRAVHFINLPPVCTISIYSLDGDLIRTIEHDASPDEPRAMSESWDLISRNTQLVVSGIYYFVVETPDGRTQIGKLALIL